ncbi:ATP-binding protein [Streptomyces sp. NPDC054841]
MQLTDCAEPSNLAREQVRQLLAGHAPATCVDDAVLVVSELVGNAVRHTADGPDCLFVEVHRDVVVLWVHDAGADADRVKARPAAASLDEPPEGGLGLRLVEELTVEWFVRPTATGKAVVAILALDGGRTT